MREAHHKDSEEIALIKVRLKEEEVSGCETQQKLCDIAVVS